ncbi:MAG: hypothetical protein ACRC4G_05550 [Alphaproteobacteria bacterium]
MWIWIAVSRLTQRILAIEVGCLAVKKHSNVCGQDFSQLKPFAVATDKWKAYRQIIPSSLLLQTKALTPTIESVNSQCETI